jgi:hypothetical protein
MNSFASSLPKSTVGKRLRQADSSKGSPKGSGVGKVKKPKTQKPQGVVSFTDQPEVAEVMDESGVEETVNPESHSFDMVLEEPISSDEVDEVESSAEVEEVDDEVESTNSPGYDHGGSGKPFVRAKSPKLHLGNGGGDQLRSPEKFIMTERSNSIPVSKYLNFT